MVGVKTWEDEQITLILTCKEQGKPVREIIDLLKARWPRKVVKDSGVRYVMTNYKDYKEAPRSKNMAGSSKSRSSQATACRTFQKRPNPKQAKPTSKRIVPSPAVNSRTQASIYSPPALVFPTMNQFALAAQMRAVSGGPITASLDVPQPFNVLNEPVHSRAKLLAHAEQAKNLGVYAIERGQAVPLSSPGAKSIVTSPTPQPSMMGPQAHATMQGAFNQNDMQRTTSMPSNFHYNQHVRMPAQNTQMHSQQGQMGPQSMQVNSHQGQMGHYMQMNGHQQLPMCPMHYGQHGLPGTPSFGGHNAQQYPGNAQNMNFQQGQPGGIGLHGGAGAYNGLPMMPWEPFGYNPYAGSQPPANPQQMYQQGTQANAFGASGGVMPPNTPFNPQINAPQVATPLNHGQLHLATPQQQRPDSRITNIDPQLRTATPSAGMQAINHSVATGFYGSRPPTRNGVSAMPQPNHIMGQQLPYGPNTAYGVNLPGNSVNQGPRCGASPAARQPSGTHQSMAQQAQNGPMTSPQANPSNTPAIRKSQIGTVSMPQQDDTLQGTMQAVPNGAVSTPQSAEGSQNEKELEKKSPDSSASQTPHKKVIIAVEGPIFETPFRFPASNGAWHTFIKEQTKKSMQQTGEYVPAPDDLEFRISNGLFEYHFKRPVFRQGIIWEENSQTSSTPNSEARSSTRANQGPNPNAASNQSEKSGPHCKPCQPAPANARETPVTVSAQKQPKTPPARPIVSSSTQVTPAVSSMKLTNGQDAPMPAAKMSAQPGPRQSSSTCLGTQNTSSTSSNNQTSGKRAAPATGQEVSPSKRHKSCVQSPSMMKPAQHFTVTKEGFDGRMEFATPAYPSAVSRSFAEQVAGRPLPNPTKTLPSDHYKRRKSRSGASSPPFNPRPSQPLKNSTLFASPHQQYSAGVARTQESMKQQLPNVADHGLVNPSNEQRPIDGILPNVSGFPWAQDGLDALQQQQTQCNANASINHQRQEYQHPSILLGEGFANSEQEKQGYDDKNSLLDGIEDLNYENASLNNDNADLDAILGISTVDPAPANPFGNDGPTQDLNASTGSDSDFNPSPSTPQEKSYVFNPFADDFYPDNDASLAQGNNTPWGDEQYDQPLFQENNEAHVEMVYVPGLPEPVKKGSIMEGFGKNLR